MDVCPHIKATCAAASNHMTQGKVLSDSTSDCYAGDDQDQIQIWIIHIAYDIDNTRVLLFD